MPETVNVPVAPDEPRAVNTTLSNDRLTMPLETESTDTMPDVARQVREVEAVMSYQLIDAVAVPLVASKLKF